VKNKMIKIKHVAFFFLGMYFQINCSALTLMPLSSWKKDKEFSTLSVADTVYVTQRCSIAYDINRAFFEDFSNLKPQGLREKVDTYRWVYSRFATLLVMDKSKSIKDNFMKSQIEESKEIYSAYFLAIKNNEPIPHSLSNELIAMDIGFCNSFDNVVFDAYKQMKK
jgi:hypothetical protein